MGLYENKNNSLSLLAGGTCYADSPVGAILPFGGSNPPSGYLICNGQAVSRTDYAELFAVIGTSFGAGDGSITFNVPDLRGKFVEGLASGESIGTSKSAGLPNIVGNASLGYNDSSAIGVMTRSANGAFTTQTDGPTYWSGPAGNTGYIYGNSFHFDASKSNSIYGNSTTVQPPAVCANYIIKAKQSALPLPFEDAVDEKISDNIINSITSGSMKAATSNAVYGFPIDSITDGEHRPPTSNAVYDKLASLIKYGSGYLQIGTVLICYGSVAPTINSTTAYGSGGLYYGTDTTTRAFAKSFASVPTIQITPHPGWGNNGSIIDCARNANGITSVTVVSNISDGAKHWNYDYVAIGTASS